jgi:CHAT domain-containing protein/tetratricopeptide (TPR) repeat protein
MTCFAGFRSACAGWAAGLVVLTAGVVPSWGQASNDPRDLAKANDQAAYTQAIQRSVNLANQEKKYAEAIREATRAQEIARKAFGPTSEQADEALHLLQQLNSMSRNTAAELRALRELIELRRERLGPRDWHVKDLEALLALRERVTALPADRQASLEEIGRQIDRATALHQRGQFDEAAAVGMVALKRWRVEMPGDTTTAATLLTRVAMFESGRKEIAKARGFLEQALAVRTRLLGEKHPDVAETILALARLADEDGDLVRARSLFERALVIRIENTKADRIVPQGGQQGDPVDSQFAALLEQVGRLLLQIGDHEAAKTQFQRAAAIHGSLADRTLAMASFSGFDMGGGRFSDMAGMGPFGMGRGGIGGRLNPGRRQESRTRRQPSMFGSEVGDLLDEDLPGFPGTLPGFGGLGGPGFGRRGGFGGGGLFGPGGYGSPSRRLDAWGAQAMIRNPTHPWSVRERAWMMLRNERLGEWGAIDAGLDGKHLMNLDGERATMRDESWIAYASCLRNLAVAMKARGDRDPARRMQLLAVAFGLEASDPSEESRPAYAAFLDDFVGLLEEFGELDLAESLAVWSIMYRRASYGERHLEYASGLARLAGVLRTRGDLAQAMLLFEKALSIRRAALAEDHPDLAEILLPTAELHNDIGNHDEARRLAGRALAISDAFLGRSLPFLPERQRLAMLALRARSVSTLLDITAGRGGPDAETYAHLVSWKGITVSAAVSQRATAGTGEVASLRTELARARDELNRLYYAVVPAEKSQEHARRTRAQVERSAALEARLAVAVGWKAERIGPPEVQAALPAGSVFIDIYHYQRRGRPAVPEGDGPFAAGPVATQSLAPGSSKKGAGDRAEGHYVAFVVRRGFPPVRVELGRSDTIDREIQAWLGLIDRGGDLEPTGRQLARAVWEPLAPFAQDATTILVSPDGALNFLPWGALPAERPGSYLLERRAFAVVPSPRQLASGPGADEKEPSHESKGLLAVGGVDYQRRDAMVPPPPPENGQTATEVVATRGAAIGSGQVVFPQLPGTLNEVNAVADVCRKSQAGPVQLLTGSQATKDRLVAAMPGNRYLLLATHGYFAPPEVQSALNAGEAAARSSWEEMSRRDVVGYHPGLLSGLAWAGASNPTADPTTGLIDRGAAIMTAEEVAALNLRGCDLAVLSACETGLGMTAGGEGVLGLQRAFLQAGARTVVASLWRVDDAATYVLMEQFHTNLWVRKLPKLEALRQAQLAVLDNPSLVQRHRAELARRGLGSAAEKLPEGGRVVLPIGAGTRSTPALWAAFVLSGDIQ